MTNEFKNNENIFKYVTRKTFFVSLLMVCAFSVLCTASALIYSEQNKHTATVTSVYDVPAVYASSTPSPYIITEKDGYLAVINERLDLFEVLDIPTSKVNASVRSELEYGISVYSVSELITTVIECLNQE